MRRRKKNRTQLSVSLFPFLAVLICTLGVLIVMLVMAVKSADVQSAKKQAEDNSEKLAQIAELNDAVLVGSDPYQRDVFGSPRCSRKIATVSFPPKLS